MCVVDAALMDTAKPRLIQQFGAGLDGVDLAAASGRGIAVANVPASETDNADSVAEIAVLLTLGLSRRLDQARNAFAARRLGQPVGRSLIGLTATVVGIGGVGTRVAHRLRPFGVRLIGVGRSPSLERADHQVLGFDEYRSISELPGVLGRTDILILCVPLTDETINLIGAPELAALRTGAIVVNVARGPILDRGALCAALESNAIAGAGLDVFWSEPEDPADPLFAHNVIATPHIAGLTDQACAATARVVVANVERLRAGQILRHRVV